MSNHDGSIPLVSVLTPCFNSASFIGETIESVLAQDYPACEMVVVDDGSTDRSAEIAESYGVQVVRQENAGAAAARNRGLAESSGAYVLFLDADDLLGPESLSSLVAAMSPGCVASGQWDRFHTNPTEAQFPDRPTYPDADGVSWIVRDWRWAEGMTASGMVMMPRALIEDVGGWDESLSLLDDFEFYARVMVRSFIRHAPGARLYYRSGLSGSLSRQFDRRAAESSLRSFQMGIDHLLAAEDSPRTRLVSANNLMQFDYRFYPLFPDLRAVARQRAASLGGGDLPPDGPPRFHKLRKFVGWRLARRVQRLGDVIRGR